MGHNTNVIRPLVIAGGRLAASLFYESYRRDMLLGPFAEIAWIVRTTRGSSTDCRVCFRGNSTWRGSLCGVGSGLGSRRHASALLWVACLQSKRPSVPCILIATQPTAQRAGNRLCHRIRILTANFRSTRWHFPKSEHCGNLPCPEPSGHRQFTENETSQAVGLRAGMLP